MLRNAAKALFYSAPNRPFPIIGILSRLVPIVYIMPRITAASLQREFRPPLLSFHSRDNRTFIRGRVSFHRQDARHYVQEKREGMQSEGMLTSPDFHVEMYQNGG